MFLSSHFRVGVLFQIFSFVDFFWLASALFEETSTFAFYYNSIMLRIGVNIMLTAEQQKKNPNICALEKENSLSLLYSFLVVNFFPPKESFC